MWLIENFVLDEPTKNGKEVNNDQSNNNNDINNNRNNDNLSFVPSSFFMITKTTTITLFASFRVDISFDKREIKTKVEGQFVHIFWLGKEKEDGEREEGGEIEEEGEKEEVKGVGEGEEEGRGELEEEGRGVGEEDGGGRERAEGGEKKG